MSLCLPVSVAVFTIEDEQIVWTDKSSDVQTGGINFSTNKSMTVRAT